MARDSFRLIAFGRGRLALAGLVIFTLLTGPFWFEDYYGIPEWPVTGNLLGKLENEEYNGIWLLIPLLIIYYAGELVWRERNVQMNEIVDAAPVPVWVLFIGKLLGLFLALAVTQLLLVVAGMLLQVLLGYYHFDIPVYLRVMFGLRLVDYVLLAVLAFAVHVILYRKYLAHLVAVLVYMAQAFGSDLGVASKLLLYASDPGWTYSGLRGFSPFMIPWLYFKSYWATWAMLLMITTALMWPRGAEQPFVTRWRHGLRQSKTWHKALALLSVGLVIGLGGSLYYRVHVLYPESGGTDTLEQKAAYEKQYERYRNRPQPSVAVANLKLEIYPEEGKAEFEGFYTLVNRTGKMIDTLMLSTSPGITYHTLQWNRPVQASEVDTRLNFGRYVLKDAIVPGDSLQLSFRLTYHPQGIPNEGMKTLITGKGTYFSSDWLPAIGYQADREIFDPTHRSARGLRPKDFLESAEDTYSRQRIQVDAVIGTDGGQLAVGPGQLLRDWTEEDRRYFHYRTDASVNPKLGFFSSDYAVHEGEWTSDSGQVVAVSILHHPDHVGNLPRMMHSLRSSLSYLSETFGAYPHGDLRLVEVPGYNKGLYAYPVNIFYREGFALLNPDDDPRGVDIVFATVAHEVAHQWWGAQVSPAPVKGAALITETLAWYCAFEIYERAGGEESLRALLEMARDDYFSPQERAADPLLRATQTSLIYRKGPLALFALGEYIGREQLRGALRTFFQTYRASEGPKPVPSDLYTVLQAVTPDSVQYLLHDLFASNTFWELRTDRVVTHPTAAGTWKVELDVFARKYTVDALGNETDVRMSDLIQVGVYAGEGEQELIYLDKHRLHSGLQTITLELKDEPSAAGVDPNFLLLDPDRWDNLAHTGEQ